MDNQKVVRFVHEEMFVDDIELGLMYECRDDINGYEDGSGRKIKRGDAADWVLKNYYNSRKFREWYNENGHGRDLDEVRLYNYDENYKRAVDEERIYLLYLMGYNYTEIGNAVGLTRQTVAKKVKSFEEERLHEFVK